jgi:hypothetical protein
MSLGWRRLGIVLSIAWTLAVSGYAIYEWQTPFYKKSLFFSVIPREEATRIDGVIPVETPFREDRFVAILVLPIAALWVLLLVVPATSWVRKGFKK